MLQMTIEDLAELRDARRDMAMRTVLALLACAALTLVAACGDGEEAPSPTGTPSATGAPATPVIVPSPSGTAPAGSLPMTKVAFATRREGAGEVYVLYPDGRQVNVSNDAAEDSNPDWSPDGKKIAFASERPGESSIYVVNEDGSGLARLTEGGEDISPRWSPDGKQIAFSRRGTLMVMDADGSNVRTVVEPATSAEASVCEKSSFAGDWSPDGQEITFYGAILGTQTGDVCIVNADGTNLRVIKAELEPLDDDGDTFVNEDDVDGADNDQDTRVDEDGPEYYVEPRWSPGGEWITYRSIQAGRYDIYVIKADGTSDTNLTDHPALDIEPDWSPDGEWIVFSSDRGGNFDLYVMRSDGSEVTRLTTDLSKDSDPAWSPE
jgi:TolB protein